MAVPSYSTPGQQFNNLISRKYFNNNNIEKKNPEKEIKLPNAGDSIRI